MRPVAAVESARILASFTSLMSAITATVDRRRHSPARLARLRCSSSRLVRLPRRVRGHARDRRPEHRRGVPERPVDHQLRGSAHALGADLPAHPALVRPAIDAASWTYWGSQFTVLGLALLWAYLRHNDAFYKFRNAIMLANLIGLVGYVLVPTAPPRMFPTSASPTRSRLRRHLAREPGRLARGEPVRGDAEPACRRRADRRLRDGVARQAAVAKVLWLAWPPWVWIVVMGTGNHYWLDIAAGVVVALHLVGDHLPAAAASPARSSQRRNSLVARGHAAQLQRRYIDGVRRPRPTASRARRARASRPMP